MIFRGHLPLILLVLICFSKEIIVFNEEILILFSFILFCFLTYTFATKPLLLELDLRSAKIEEELTMINETQKKVTKLLVSFYIKQKTLFERIECISLSVDRIIDSFLNDNFRIYIKLLVQSINDKLEYIASSDLRLKLFIQKETIDVLSVCLLTYGLTLFKEKSKKRKLMQRAFKVLQRGLQISKI